MKLAGKVAVITGGGRGIGRAIGLSLAREGASIVVSARTRSEIDEVAQEIESLGQKSLAIQADVSREEDVKQMVEESLNAFRRLDILVNNAGVNLPSRNVVDLTLAEWNRVIQVNVTGPFLCSRAALPTMIQQRSGKIINISSIGARYAHAGRTPYRTSKLALLQFTYCLAAEVKQYGIDVNAVCPGPTDTRMMREIARGGVFPNMSRPEEIADVVLFLASPESSAITGTAIDAFGANNPLFRSSSAPAKGQGGS
jgi:NAD(P)-dependent dehydrogenase (short-subunit alcohol dehydrogenase family)